MNEKSKRIERDIAAVRARVEEDIEALGRRVRDDRDEVKVRLQNNAVLIASGVAVLGVILGVGGKQALKFLVPAGIAAAAVLIYLKRVE